MITTIYLTCLISLISSLGNADASTKDNLIRIPLNTILTLKKEPFTQPEIIHFTRVSIGTPEQEFKIRFDLSSNELFVPNLERHKLHQFLHYYLGFSCEESKTCTRLSVQNQILYEGYRFEGDLYDDYVHFPTRNNRTLSYTQKFLGIRNAYGNLEHIKVDGYFGLGTSLDTKNRQPGILKSLYQEREIDNLQFSFWFNMVGDVENGGELILGGIDNQRLVGDMIWHQSATKDHWSLKLKPVAVGANLVSCIETTCSAVLSTSVSDIYGPPDDVYRIYDLLGVNLNYGLPFLNFTMVLKAPTITLMLDNVRYQFAPSSYISSSLYGYYVNIFPKSSGNIENEWILGTSFLSAYYTAFDLTTNQIGFGTLRLS